MLTRYYIKRYLGCLLALGLVAAILGGCSKEPTAGGDDASPVALNMSIATPEMVDMIDSLYLRVSADDIERDIVSPLVRIGRYVEATVLVPAGRDRLIELEAFDARGTRLYYGDTLVDIAPASVTELTINMYPQVSLVRLSPGYHRVFADSTFAVDIKACNIADLYGMSLRLNWTGPVSPDTALLNPALGDILFFARQEPGSQFYAMTVSQTDQMTPIVDADGNVTLATAYFHAAYPDFLADTAYLTIEVTEMTNTAFDTIPLNTVLTDGCTIEVYQTLITD